MSFRFSLLLTTLFASSSLFAGVLQLSQPLDYQVIQRNAANRGDVLIQGTTDLDLTGATFQSRIAKDGEWQPWSAKITKDGFSGHLEAPAGGWHRLEVRVTKGDQVLGLAVVEHLGVGEVFVVAGQSNSANHGQEKQNTQTQRVASFDGQRWQLTNDPQPGASGRGGSFMPPLGDALVKRFDVPIGFIACGLGGSSVREWLPKGSTFPNPPTVESRVEKRPDGTWASKGAAYDAFVARMKSAGTKGFRAVLWHQGESDANQKDATRTLTGRLYREYLEKLIRDSRRDIGWDPPWFVAQVSYHVPGDEASPDIRAAQASLWKDGIALEGPDSDALKGKLRERDGQGVHFSGAGLQAHAAAWAAKLTPWLEQQQSAERLLGLRADTHASLAKATHAGLIEIAPVHLPPVGVGDCNHYGWPIATMTGDTIVVMHRRIPGHNPKGAGQPDPSMSYGIVLRSDDGGSSWSEPYDLRECMKPEDRARGGLVPLSHRAKFDPGNMSKEGYKVHLHAIGTARDGAVVAVNNHGVFRSDDGGQTWRHFSTALRDDTFPHPLINIGPRIVDHPAHGLMVFGNWFGMNEAQLKKNGLPQQFVALKSGDGGATWMVEEHAVGFPQFEPAALLHDERLLFVTRDQTQVRAHKQLSWQPGQPPQVIDTNLEDPRLVDTVDFSFNPFTRRFELVRSERHHMELWLWSMDPADWKSGQWQRECRLFAREGSFYKDADGFHPAGAVIDAKRGAQHIFFYCGHPNGPAGVFRMTRTLDTPKLAASLKPSANPK